MKRYFKKRKNDLLVDNFNVWTRLLKIRRKKLINFLESKGETNEFFQKLEMFLSQVFIIHANSLEVIKNFNLNVTEKELNELNHIEYGNIEDVDRLINYLDYLADELAIRHEVSTMNTRFFFFPITKGEAIGVISIGILIAFVI